MSSKKTTADNDLMYYSDENIFYTKKLENDIKICTPLTMSQCEQKGIKYQQSNSYVLKTNDEPFYGWGNISDPNTPVDPNANPSDVEANSKIKPEELYIDYFYRQYCRPAQIIEFNVDNGWAFGTETSHNSYFGFSTILSQYTIQMQYPGLSSNRYYCMSMDWSIKNKENNMKVREVLTYNNPFS
jgi:hypothetical protein